MTTRITFLTEEDDHDQILDQVTAIGGYDIDIDEWETPPDPSAGNREKKPQRNKDASTG